MTYPLVLGAIWNHLANQRYIVRRKPSLVYLFLYLGALGQLKDKVENEHNSKKQYKATRHEKAALPNVAKWYR